MDYGPAAVPYFGDFTDRIGDFFKAIGESTIGGSVIIDRYIASADIVVTQGQYTGTVRTTGAKIDSPIAHVFTLGDGKVTSWKGLWGSGCCSSSACWQGRVGLAGPSALPRFGDRKRTAVLIGAWVPPTHIQLVCDIVPKISGVNACAG